MPTKTSENDMATQDVEIVLNLSNEKSDDIIQVSSSNSSSTSNLVKDISANIKTTVRKEVDLQRDISSVGVMPGKPVVIPGCMSTFLGVQNSKESIGIRPKATLFSSNKTTTSVEVVDLINGDEKTEVVVVIQDSNDSIDSQLNYHKNSERDDEKQSYEVKEKEISTETVLYL